MSRTLVTLLLLATGCARAADYPNGPVPTPTCRLTEPVSHGDERVQWVIAAGDATELDAWCAAVGPAVVGNTAPWPSAGGLRGANGEAAHEYGEAAPAYGSSSGDDGHGALSASAAAAGPGASAWHGPWAWPVPASGSHVLPEPPEPVDSLLVVSWNIHVGGGDVRLFTEQLRSGMLTDGVPVRHFVLLIQEAYRSDVDMPDPGDAGRGAARIAPDPPTSERLPIDELAQELGLSFVYVPSMRNGPVSADGSGEDRGNAILSTLPLYDPVALELPVVRQRRVAVVAMVGGVTSGGSAWELQVASVHLENRGGRDLVGVSGRAEQAAWLLQALPPAEHAVLGGDLNTWVQGANEPAKRVLRRRYPATPSALPRGPTHASHLVVRGHLDFLFARLAGGRMNDYDRAASAYGSDHFPVLAWVHLPRYR
jgi:endonuclease/exonuclease/phosphatase family metal-dependent hydrolase